MNQGTVAGIARTLRPIVVRPRLTDLMHRAAAQLIVLVAPAGYGKTTLAREWVSGADRFGTWFRAGPGASDVAALAAGVADAIGAVVPGASQDLRQRLKATRDPEADACALNDMLARHLDQWPSDAWLVIDDYHYIARSPVAEAFLARLADENRINLLVAARQRPSWVTPRRLIYGDILELNRSALAMTQEEAAQVVGAERLGSAAGLFALAEGWPAVIGLAVHVEDLDFGVDMRLPPNLYDFFAEELFQATPASLRTGLYQLALHGSTSTNLAKELLLDAAALEQLQELGFVTFDDDLVAIHPLLRTFLFGKLRREDTTFIQQTVGGAVRCLSSLRRWDDAFELIETFQVTEFLPAVVEEGLYDLLSSGRVPTVERWVTLLRTRRADDGLVDLLEAEILFRRGEWAESERLGNRAAERFSDDHRLRSRAFFRAGQSAQFGDRLVEAIVHHKQARESARTPPDLSQAVWGLFITQIELEIVDEARESISEFEANRSGSVEDEIRLIGSSLTRWVRENGLGRTHELERRALPFLSQPADPVVRCAFYQGLAISYALGGNYRDALRAAENELAEAQHNFLAFVVPHALTNHGLAYLGLRLFRNARSCLESAESAARTQDDLHSQLNTVAIRARLLLATGHPDAAVSACQVSLDRLPNPGMLADFLSTKALALACAGDSEQALGIAAEASSTSRLIETRVQCAAARTIAAVRSESDDVDAALQTLIDEVNATGNVDGLISAYRGFPQLLPWLASKQYGRLTEILKLGRDLALGRSMGLAIPDNGVAKLTRREHEVFELIRRGRTNREIARALWITEKTAKVHVHHILEKLGARSRTEAAIIGLEADEAEGPT